MAAIVYSLLQGLRSPRFIAFLLLLIIGFLEVPIFRIPMEVVVLCFVTYLTTGFAYGLIYQVLASNSPFFFRAIFTVVAGLVLLMGMRAWVAVFGSGF